MSATPIPEGHREAFDALRDPDYENFALYSCFVNGESTSAICTVTYDEYTREYFIRPLFVAVTPGMVLTDHEGIAL